MKKIIGLIIGILFFVSNTKAIKIKFTVANTSVNVAEGSTGVFTAFELYPNTFIDDDTTNNRGLIDFENISYSDITEVVIEKMDLNVESKDFEIIANFNVVNEATFGYNDDENIIQGGSYAYRLVLITKTGQQLNIINKTTTPDIAHPEMNCAKLNNIYRKAGHNNFQESVMDPANGGFYRTLDFTRVVELDVHASNNPSTWNWAVRHEFNGPNSNNCGYGTGGDKPFGICIDDIKKWHNDHPNHDVITIFIDLKSDWNENNNNQTPTNLDARLEADFGTDNIYKPRDLLGYNHGDMRVAAQQNNWPSMGDLTGKMMFVLTGSGSRISQYIADRSLNAVAFSAASVKTVLDVLLLPGIWQGLKNDIVFYNMQQFNDIPFVGGDADFNTGYVTANLGYINRTYGIGQWGQPGGYNYSEYQHAKNFNMNNIAVANITSSFNVFGLQENGIQFMTDVTYPGVANDRIYSNHQNVTQAAIHNIVATDLVVEQGAHYRMIAGQSIDLQPGVDIQYGSDVDIRIDDCTQTANYSGKLGSIEPMSQAEIDAIMHELNKELFSYTPEDENEVVRLKVYPNPTNNVVNISYTNYLLKQATITLQDITGRAVITKNYQPQTEGKQHFKIDVNHLKEGTYFYTLQIGEQINNGKVVKIN